MVQRILWAPALRILQDLVFINLTMNLLIPGKTLLLDYITAKIVVIFSSLPCRTRNDYHCFTNNDSAHRLYLRSGSIPRPLSYKDGRTAVQRPHFPTSRSLEALVAVQP